MTATLTKLEHLPEGAVDAGAICDACTAEAVKEQSLDLSSLTDDGDTLELADGRKV
jgi:hypothetical protein